MVREPVGCGSAEGRRQSHGEVNWFYSDAIPVQDPRDITLIVNVDIFEVQGGSVECEDIGDEVCFEILCHIKMKMTEMNVLPCLPEITDRSVAQGGEKGVHGSVPDVEEVICDSRVRTIDTSIVPWMVVLSKSSLTGFVVRSCKRLAIRVGCDGADFDFSASCPKS